MTTDTMSRLETAIAASAAVRDEKDQKTRDEQAAKARRGSSCARHLVRAARGASGHCGQDRRSVEEARVCRSHYGEA